MNVRAEVVMIAATKWHRPLAGETRLLLDIIQILLEHAPEYAQARVRALLDEEKRA